jgi:hypothetical protein
LWVAATGRARLVPGRTIWGPRVRLLGLLCAALAAGLAWFILTHPVVNPQP